MSEETFSSEIHARERKDQIAELQRKLEIAKWIPQDDLAAQIKKIGFRCLCCGECCAGEDNSVVVFPFEIERIAELTGLSWQEVVEPPIIGEWDRNGNFHTLEWRIKKGNGSCRFHSYQGCSIYPARPLLCGTYPFYLDDCALRCSECRGLGQEMDLEEADEIAFQLIERCITELEESIALLEKYKDFERGSPRKDGDCIVHDSRGANRICGSNLPHLFYRFREDASGK